MADIKFQLSAEDKEAIEMARDAARAFRDTGNAVQDTSGRLQAYHAELSAASNALGAVSADLKGVRSDIQTLSENILKLQASTASGSRGIKEMSEATKQARQEAKDTIGAFEAMGKAAEKMADRDAIKAAKEQEEALKAIQAQAGQMVGTWEALGTAAAEESRRQQQASQLAQNAARAEAAARAAAMRTQIDAMTGLERERRREVEGLKDVASSVRKLSDDERALVKAMEMQDGATSKTIRVGTEYYQVTHDQVEAMQLLSKTHRSSQLAHEKTAEDLERLKKAYTAGLIPLDQFTEAEARLTSKLEDQQKRWEANKGRSLSMLKDELESAIRQFLPFGNVLVNFGNHFSTLTGIAKEHGGSVRDIAREYAEGGKQLKTLDGNAKTVAEETLPALTSAMSVLLNPLTLVALGLVAVSAGLIAVGVHSAPFVHDMRDLENTLGLVGKETAEARSQMEMLNEKALQASELGIGPREAAAAMGQLASLGLNATDTLKAFEPVALLAKARNLDMATAAKIAGAQMAIFGTDVNDLGIELDKLSIISNLTGIQASDLQVMMAKAGKGAVAAGQDFNSIAIAAGLARNAAIPMDEVMQGLGSGLLQVASKGRAAFISLTNGKDVVDSVTGKFRPLESILLDVTEATKNMNDADRSARIEKVFGRESLTALLPIMQQLTNGIKDQSGKLLEGADAAKYMREQLDQAAGSNKRFAENLQDTLQGQQERFSALIDSIETGIGQHIEPALKSLYGVANAVLGVINDIFSGGSENSRSQAEQLDGLMKKAAELEQKMASLDMSSVIDRESIPALAAQYKLVQDRIKELSDEKMEAQKKASKMTAEEVAAVDDLNKKEKAALDALLKDIDSLNAAAMAGRARIEAERKAALQDIQRDIDKARDAGLQAAAIYDAFKTKQAATNRKFDAEIAKLGEDEAKKRQEQMQKVREETQKLIREGLEPLQKAEYEYQQQVAKATDEYKKGMLGRVDSAEAMLALETRMGAVEQAYTKTVRDESAKRAAAIKKDTEEREKAELAAITKAIDADRKAAEARKAFQTTLSDVTKQAGNDRQSAQEAIDQRIIDDSAKVMEAWRKNQLVMNETQQGALDQGLANDDAANEERIRQWKEVQDSLTAIQERASRERGRVAMDEAGKWLSITSQLAGNFNKLSSTMLSRYEDKYQDTTASMEKTTEELADMRKRSEEGTLNYSERMHMAALERKLKNEKATAEKQKAEAIKAFEFQKDLEMVQAAIAGAQAVMQAMKPPGGPPPNPIGIAGIATATAITATEIGLMASQQPPQMHVGGTTSEEDIVNNIVTMPSVRLQPDERLVNELVGEGKVNRAGMRRLGEDGLERLNRLGEMPEQTINIAFQLGHKVMDQVAYRSTRSGGGPYNSLVRSMTNARTGHRSRR